MALNLDTKRIERSLLTMQARVLTSLMRGARKLGAAMLRDAKRNSPKLSGDLYRRLKVSVTEHGGKLDSGKSPDRIEVKVGVGTGVGGEPLVYARIQDLGGLIRPVTAQKLAIPVHPSFFTKAGVGGVRARDVIQAPERYGFKSTFTTENAILGTPEGGGDSVILFARVSSVFIHGSRYLQDAKAEGRKRAPAILLTEVNKALNKATSGINKKK